MTIKSSQIKRQLLESLGELLGENIYLVLVADGEDVGRELIPPMAVVRYRWDIICRALQEIEAKCGESLLHKKLSFRLEHPDG